ncbi:hypothetical protein B9Z55_015298 [Caenorhabditis nigoni]|uniref:F-box associated domain-containing protein n=1 Tax=Caenorhabditis nigoni TaxID=1611254 RepID=A0A2G5UA41_9PELO|nr:hypothetical protein B9Z55_015298 [Caenorhabditis nigoni]
MEYIKKVGVFENLEVSFGGLLTDNGNFITDDGLFTATNIVFEGCDKNNMVPVQNVPYWHIRCYEENDSLYKVAKMWIDTNSKVGSTFQVSVNEEGSFEGFLEHFIDCIVSKNEKRVRICTNNPDRHILLERALDEIFGTDYDPQYFRLKVISAEMKESDYDDDYMEWIYIIDPYLRDESSSSDEYDSDSSSSSDGDGFYGEDYNSYNFYSDESF